MYYNMNLSNSLMKEKEKKENMKPEEFFPKITINLKERISPTIFWSVLFLFCLGVTLDIIFHDSVFDYSLKLQETI